MNMGSYKKVTVFKIIADSTNFETATIWNKMLTDNMLSWLISENTIFHGHLLNCIMHHLNKFQAILKNP